MASEEQLPEKLHSQTESQAESSNLEQALLKAVFEQAIDAIAIADDQGHYVEVNPAACKLFGLPREKLIGLQIGDFVLPGFDFPQAWQIFLQEGHQQGEFLLLRPDQTVRDVEFAATANCLPHRHLSILRDITEQKQIREALKESERLYRAVVEDQTELICRFLADGTLIFVNESYCRYFQMQREELLGSSFMPVIPDADKEIVAANFASLSRENSVVTHEHRVFVRGEIRWQQWTNRAIFDDQSDQIEFQGVGRDITERKQAESELEKYRAHLGELVAKRTAKLGRTNKKLQQEIRDRQQAEAQLSASEARYRSLADNMSDGIYLVGADFQLLFCNLAIERIFGISRDSFSSHYPQGFLACIHPQDRPQVFMSFFSGIKQDHVELIYRILHPNGEIRHIRDAIHRIDNSGQEIVAYQGIVSDITELALVGESLRQQAEEERLSGAIAQRIRKSLNLEEILNTTVAEVRQLLQCDRVLIYRFEPDWSGMIAAESVVHPWLPMQGMKIIDTYLVREMCIQPYIEGRVQAVEDIYTDQMALCYVDLLAQFQVRANLVTGLLQGEQLWGLLVAQHCAQPRRWQDWEIGLLKRLASQVSIAIQQSQLYQQLQSTHQTLQHLAGLDGLTQVANRRRFDEYLYSKWQELEQEQTPLSLILGDVDFFKLYNDTYGHLAGDEVLRQVSRTLSQTVNRPTDLVARYGGEEFAVILPRTDAQAVLEIAKLIHTQIKALQIPHANSQIGSQITISLGVATLIPDGQSSPEMLIAKADQALYQAKAAGRDRWH